MNTQPPQQPAPITLDGNEAIALNAYRLNEVFAIYPITPSSPIAEHCDEWSSQERENLWGDVPQVVEMQSEGGAAGLLHGSLQGGALTSTFTASQGLLLMVPNLYKIAGELTPCVIHVTARTIATHALSIFGDHSDVMACRQCGWAMLSAASVQEGHDFAVIAQAATLRSRVPFMHFIDGFRTSHEVAKITPVSEEALHAMVPVELVKDFRGHRLTPDQPVIRGTAQNPDAFFQAREAINPYYAAVPGIVREEMARFAELTGRHYSLVDYEGDPQAERVVVIMGSGAETTADTVHSLNRQGEKVGVLKLRLFRPFPVEDFIAALPDTVTSIAVLDRTKEPGAPAEPLHLDVLAALDEAREDGSLPLGRRIRVIGGRYGLGSKEFTPAMVKAVFGELAGDAPRRQFTVGINDDVSHLSLGVEPDFDIEEDDVRRAVFFGLGADGTVGANKNTIKIIGEETDFDAQGYFVYDSKKSGAMTISHLRFGPRRIRAPYLIREAPFVACHQFQFLGKFDVLGYAAHGATLLLNTAGPVDKVWDRLPGEVREQIIARKLRVFGIDAYAVARRAGMGGRINTIMQVGFFALSEVLPAGEAIEKIKQAIKKTYSRKGEEVVKRNWDAVDATLAALHEIEVPASAGEGDSGAAPLVSPAAPEFVQRVTAVMLAGKGDQLPVSAFPVDGTWPLGTTQWEKRNIAREVPVWNSDICIQCNKCVLVCPHATIRAKYYPAGQLEGAPAGFHSTEFRSRDHDDHLYTLQVATEDCTGCSLCVQVCPVKDKANPSRKAINMEPQAPIVEVERANYDFFLGIPEVDRAELKPNEVKSSQFLQPLFEYSGACAGCGETPYIKLLSQLFGDRAIIANATGCSSIYGGNLPSTPYTTNGDGRGPAWANSLFEDNAEFGAGIRTAADQIEARAQRLLRSLAPQLGDEFVRELLVPGPLDEAALGVRREQVAALRGKLAAITGGHRAAAAQLDAVADALVPKSVWIVGGDGWAYDIGFGGLDHVFSLGRNVNILVLDTEVYSNTGGQRSKSTPLGATAKFSMGGKETPKKDLGMIAMTYGGIYVAAVAFGAKDSQTLAAFREAEAYDGPSLILAYSHCIAHGYNLLHGLDQQKLAVSSGHWPLYRYDPRKRAEGANPLKLDSPKPKASLESYRRNEVRFLALEKIHPQRAQEFARTAAGLAARRYDTYQQLAAMHVLTNGNGAAGDAAQDD